MADKASNIIIYIIGILGLVLNKKHNINGYLNNVIVSYGINYINFSKL